MFDETLLGIKKKFLEVNLYADDRTLSLYVSGASQTDRRKTVACYIINIGIIKIRGVLDSVPLDVSPPESVEVSGMVNQAPLCCMYTVNTLGQQAKVFFAGVVIVVIL